MQALRFLNSLPSSLMVGKPNPKLMLWPNPVRSDRTWNINYDCKWNTKDYKSTKKKIA
jgi:hypothetical protein